MAPFKIHEDNCVLAAEEKENTNKEKKSRIPKKVLPEKRRGLQCVNNGVRQENKKIKIGNKENMPPQEVITNAQRKVSKVEIDTNLLKIVAGDKEISKNKDDITLPLSRPQLLSSDYSEDIWNYYKEAECSALPKPNYMDKQAHLAWNMRRILVDWLVCVGDEYNMSEDTLHLAVNFIDRFLSKISVVRDKLQLVGACAMLIAGKLEEIYPPMPKEWAYLTGDTYTTHQVLKMEQLIMKILEFKLQPPTTYNFVKSMCNKCDLDEVTTNLALYMTELVLVEGEQYLNYKPSEIAAASLLHARFNLMKPDVWPKECEKVSGYTIKHLSPIVKAQSVTLKESPLRKQQAVQKKYTSPKYRKVALLKPRSVKINFLSLESEESGPSLEGGGELLIPGV